MNWPLGVPEGAEILRVFTRDVAPSEGWELFQWCFERGADEFTVNVIGTEGSEENARLAEWLGRLDRFKKPKGVRPVLTISPGQEWRQEVELWDLNEQTLMLLKEWFIEGPLEYAIEEGGWVEDPIIYRGAEILLGIVSHEQEGVLQVRPGEAKEIRGRFQVRDEGEWVA